MLPDNDTDFIKLVKSSNSLDAIRNVADEVLGLADDEKRRKFFAIGNQVQPFFIPHRTGAPAQVSNFQLVSSLGAARMAAAHSRSTRVIVSAPMKSGSTYISEALAGGLRLPKVNVIMLLAQHYDYANLGAQNRSQEIDEVALLNACLFPEGFVSHNHMLCTPYLAGQANVYDLKFVLMKRNIFDCLVSLDDFNMAELKKVNDPFGRYFWHPMPPGWMEMDFEDRIHHLLDRSLWTYVHYYVSWKLLEGRGWIKPFWVSYEDDVLAEKGGLAERLCGWLGRGQDTAALTAEMERDKSPVRTNFNKGVSGRGSAIQGKNRDRVLDTFKAFEELADWSEILD